MVRGSPLIPAAMTPIPSNNTVESPTKHTSFISILIDLWQVNIFNLPKLITKEDGNYGHIHKILGISCLAHYIYRLYCLLRFGSMGFDSSYLTLFCIGLHVLLSGTSFIFHISPTRIRGAPMIYPEFRLHSIIFAYRSLVVMILQWLCLRFQTPLPLYARGAVVIVTMLCADRVTKAHKVCNEPSIR